MLSANKRTLCLVWLKLKQSSKPESMKKLSSQGNNHLYKGQTLVYRHTESLTSMQFGCTKGILRTCKKLFTKMRLLFSRPINKTDRREALTINILQLVEFENKTNKKNSWGYSICMHAFVYLTLAEVRPDWEEWWTACRRWSSGRHTPQWEISGPLAGALEGILFKKEEEKRSVTLVW